MKDIIALITNMCMIMFHMICMSQYKFNECYFNDETILTIFPCIFGYYIGTIYSHVIKYIVESIYGPFGLSFVTYYYMII